MTELTFNDVKEKLEKYKAVLVNIDQQKMKSEIKVIESMITILKKYNDAPLSAVKQQLVPAERKLAKKQTFREAIDLLNTKNYREIIGVKLNFEQLSDTERIFELFEKKSKQSILRETTTKDLKLIYSLLTDDPTERKRKKGDLYEAIKSNIRARKSGRAFAKLI